nr:MAG TPA: hypothetical protein [Caudoviricetes sp.]
MKLVFPSRHNPVQDIWVEYLAFIVSIDINDPKALCLSAH